MVTLTIKKETQTQHSDLFVSLYSGYSAVSDIFLSFFEVETQKSHSNVSTRLRLLGVYPVASDCWLCKRLC